MNRRRWPGLGLPGVLALLMVSSAAWAEGVAEPTPSAQVVAAPAMVVPDGAPDIHLPVPAHARGLEVNVVEHGIAPGRSSGWHTHPGDEIAYVLKGQLELRIAGGPIRLLSPGDTYQIARGEAHVVSNNGTAPAAVLITYLKDRGKPWKRDVPAPTGMHP